MEITKIRDGWWGKEGDDFEIKDNDGRVIIIKRGQIIPLIKMLKEVIKNGLLQSNRNGCYNKA